MAFYVGQKVVCVSTLGKASFSARHPGVQLPEEKAIYTVRSVFSRSGAIVLLLDEIRNHVHEDSEPAFRAHRFRPLVEKKTDISIFTKMLTPTQVNA